MRRLNGRTEKEHAGERSELTKARMEEKKEKHRPAVPANGAGGNVRLETKGNGLRFVTVLTAV